MLNRNILIVVLSVAIVTLGIGAYMRIQANKTPSNIVDPNHSDTLILVEEATGTTRITLGDSYEVINGQQESLPMRLNDIKELYEEAKRYDIPQSGVADGTEVASVLVTSSELSNQLVVYQSDIDENTKVYKDFKKLRKAIESVVKQRRGLKI